MEKAEQVGKWCNLPDDILAVILSHLVGKDYLSFLSVCCSWRSTPPPLRSIPNPYFSNTSEASRYPSLFHFDDSSKCEFYDPFYNGSYVADQIPDELIDSRICFSNHGWLLMSQPKQHEEEQHIQLEQLVFFHPFTHQRIFLPSHFLPECVKLCFSSPPTSPDCMVFGMGDDAFYCFRLGHDNEIRWEEVDSLGDNMIFASRTGCISMQTHTMGNTIQYIFRDSTMKAMAWFIPLHHANFTVLG